MSPYCLQHGNSFLEISIDTYWKHLPSGVRKGNFIRKLTVKTLSQYQINLLTKLVITLFRSRSDNVLLHCMLEVEH